MMYLDSINYSRIGQAQLFYKASGYPNLMVPWLVSPHAVLATLPVDAKMFQTHAGVCVGSAEQSFIQLMLQNQLEPGRWQASSPCFRDEKEYNELTLQSFFKTELIWYMPEETEVAFQKLVNDALQCFFAISDVETYEVVQTSEGCDIFYNGIELGSYGVRRMNDHVWVYGTGLAEPRFTIALQKQHRIAAISMGSSQLRPTEEPQDTPTSEVVQAQA